MTKFNKPCVLKNGSVLQAKWNETWFAIKGRGMKKADIKEFKIYLRDCCVEFLRTDKEVENATDPSTKTCSVEEGKGKIEKVESTGESEKGEEPT